jgi:hypothetical protein
MQMRAVWVLVFCALCGLGCGDDDAANTKDASTSDASTKMDAARPPTPAQDSAMPMTMTAEPVPCGSTMCQPPSSPLAALGGAIPGLGALTSALPMPVACCLDSTAGTCGLAMTKGATCEPRATADTRCPSVDLGQFMAIAGNMGFGCCTSDNLCGIDGSVFGRGCIEDAEAGAMLQSAGLGGFIMVPDARQCDGTLIVPDAGITGDFDGGQE